MCKVELPQRCARIAKPLRYKQLKFGYQTHAKILKKNCEMSAAGTETKVFIKHKKIQAPILCVGL
jgi:hypothetical protein